MLFGYPHPARQGFERRCLLDRSWTSSFTSYSAMVLEMLNNQLKKACSLFQKLIGEPAEIEDSATWHRWIKILDSSLLGACQSTFVAVAVIGNAVIGASAGDSRLYLFDREGELRILTENRKRLGSGHAEAFMIRHSFRSGEILLMMSDGAYGPLSLYALKKAIVRTASRHFSEMPEAILEAAKTREDDATIVALRLPKIMAPEAFD